MLKNKKNEVFNMKKTLSRTLSLLLVLAMVLTFVPMSLATEVGSVTVTPGDT